MEVIWSPTALREVARVFDYLREFNSRAAAEVAAGLIEAGDSLENFPHRVRAVRGTGLRELVTAYSYIIRCRVGRDAVRILRVRHTARRPLNQKRPADYERPGQAAMRVSVLWFPSSASSPASSASLPSSSLCSTKG